MTLKHTEFFAVCLLIIGASCQRDETDFNTTTASDLALAQGKMEEMYDISEEGVNYSQHDPNGKRAVRSWYLNQCVTVTVDSAWPDTTYPKTIVVDFGSGCTGVDGRTRSGKLTITATGRYRETGSQFTVAPDNFYIDGYRIEGTKTVLNQGLNSANNLVYTVQVANGKVTKPDGSTVQYTSLRQREWVAGMETNIIEDGVPGRTDDVYSITGTTSGINSEGRSFSAPITNPLVVELDCRHVVSGTLVIAPSGLESRTIDWGTGACDNVATVTVADRTFTVSLR